MSLASFCSQQDGQIANVAAVSLNSTGGRLPRWSKMRSREGSEAGVSAIGASERRLHSTRSLSAASLNSARVLGQSARERPYAAMPNSARTFDDRGAGYSPAVSSSGKLLGAADTPRARPGTIEDAEIRRIMEAVGHSCLDTHGSLKSALRDIRTDSQGNLRRADVRRFFESHRVATRMADRFFDHLTGADRGSCNGDDAASTISMNTMKRVFDYVVGDHLGKGEHRDHQQHHHHHNVHGLLRPQHSEGSILSIPNADAHFVMTRERLKKIANQMTSKHQRRYIDKYGNIDRQELQHLFEGYGLTPEQSNQLFDRIDSNRTGEIKFKELHDHLGRFLHVKDKAQKKKSDPWAHVRGEPLDDVTMDKICDHIGNKAAQKYRTMQRVFRQVDRDVDNKVDRFEVRNLFRTYGSSTKLADRFFDTLDTQREGKIDMAQLQEKLAPHVQLGYHAPVTREAPRTAWQGTEKQPTAGRPSMRSPSVASSIASSCEDELHANRFGRFQGISTYQASFRGDIYKEVH